MAVKLGSKAILVCLLCLAGGAACLSTASASSCNHQQHKQCGGSGHNQSRTEVSHIKNKINEKATVETVKEYILRAIKNLDDPECGIKWSCQVQSVGSQWVMPAKFVLMDWGVGRHQAIIKKNYRKYVGGRAGNTKIKGWFESQKSCMQENYHKVVRILGGDAKESPGVKIPNSCRGFAVDPSGALPKAKFATDDTRHHAILVGLAWGHFFAKKNKINKVGLYNFSKAKGYSSFDNNGKRSVGSGSHLIGLSYDVAVDKFSAEAKLDLLISLEAATQALHELQKEDMQECKNPTIPSRAIKASRGKDLDVSGVTPERCKPIIKSILKKIAGPNVKAREGSNGGHLLFLGKQKATICKRAKKTGRYSESMIRHSGPWPGHGDHFHISLACPPGPRGAYCWNNQNMNFNTRYSAKCVNK